MNPDTTVTMRLGYVSSWLGHPLTPVVESLVVGDRVRYVAGGTALGVTLRSMAEHTIAQMLPPLCEAKMQAIRTTIEASWHRYRRANRLSDTIRLRIELPSKLRLKGNRRARLMPTTRRRKPIAPWGSS